MHGTGSLKAAERGASVFLCPLPPATFGVLLSFLFPVFCQTPRTTLAAVRQESQPGVQASGARPPSAEEQFFFRAANNERKARGLLAYEWNDALAAAARKHASRMAKADELSHQLAGEPALDERAAQAGARFSSVGENVAIGTDTPGIQDGWMESPGHRANILRPQFTALGVGVVQSEGKFYAVEDFSAAVEDLTPEQQEKKVAALLEARGLRVLSHRTEARKACAKTYVPVYRSAISILRLEVPDLNAVSPEIERSLHGKTYGAAEVGACPPAKSEDDIVRFRVVILLFPDVGSAISN